MNDLERLKQLIEENSAKTAAYGANITAIKEKLEKLEATIAERERLTKNGHDLFYWIAIVCFVFIVIANIVQKCF